MSQSDKVSNQIVQATKITESHRGPLPLPSHLKQYGEIDPSFPERIMKMAEANNNAAIEDSHKALDASVREVKRGQILSFVIAMTGLLVGSALVIFCKSSAGVATMLTGVSPILVSAIESIMKKK